MTCPRCSFENPERMHFCGRCGFALSILPEQPTVAPSPEEKLRKIQRYLPRALIEKILAQKDRIEGERRQVTIMFCDMKGFTPLTERLGPEETFTLMDKVVEILIHRVNEYEGTVNEIRGDGILAVFGALDALEDAPQRAILSAIDIHKRVAEFSEGLARDPRIGPIQLRIGINTGPVVIGTVGNDLRVQFTVVGDTINMASRMESLAEPGTTYVTDDTYRLTENLFHFHALGKKAIKGKQDPVSVYQVLRPRSKLYRPRLGSERMIYASLVDRGAQLNLLELQVMKLINGQGSVVNIVGEAGVGKSRLLAELKNREVMKKVTLLEGWAMSIGRNLSFHPITDILKQWAGIKADDVEAAAFNKLQAALRRLLHEDHPEVLPFVATLMGVKLPQSLAERLKGIEGEALQKLILRSMRNLLIKASETSPLIIVMEDLHWADKSSIELLDSLLRLAETQSIMFVNVFRPGYRETGDRILQGLKDRHHVYSVQIQVDPLDEKDTTSLIKNIARLGDVHGPLITQIVERTGGNPFFVEEVMRSFVDEHALVMQNGAFHATEKVNSLPIPSTIRDVLTARMDRLDEQSRDLLKVASVIGRTFLRRILLEVAPSVEEIDAKLSHFQEIQFIRERTRWGETEYLFNHALVQETAYESILPLKRKELHLKVAQAFESLFEERLHELYGMLAYHYSMAESPEETEEYLIKAGEEALKSAASNEALYYYQEALSIYLSLRGDSADPEKVAMLEKNIGLALFNRGHYAEAIEHFDKALSYYWGDLPKNAWSTAFRFVFSFAKLLHALYFPSLWFKKTPRQKDNEAIDLFYKRAEILVVINPKRFFIESIFFCDTIIHFDLAKFRLGAALFVGTSAMFSFTGLSHRISKRILDYAKPRLAPDDAKQSIVFDLMDTQYRFLKGEWNEIAECNEDLVKRNLEIGEVFYASHHYYWHGLSKVHQGYFDTARLMVEKLGALGEAYENDVYRLLKFLLNINLLIESRNLMEATAQVNQGIDLVERNSWRQSALTMHSLKTSIHLQMKEMEEAKTSLDLANQIRSEVKAVPLQLSFFYRSQFEYDIRRLEEAFANGLKNEASKHLKNAVTSGKMLMKTCRKAALYRTEFCRLMGVYRWLISDRKGALKWWQKAVSEGESLRARPHLARVHHEIGKRLSCSEGADPEFIPGRAREHLVKAEKMFREMGLRQDLQELVPLVGKSE
jgi:class 3 adenylate cyclase/tetratricopeptide (TPR) repeat protein